MSRLAIAIQISYITTGTCQVGTRNAMTITRLLRAIYNINTRFYHHQHRDVINETPELALFLAILGHTIGHAQPVPEAMASSEAASSEHRAVKSSNDPS